MFKRIMRQWKSSSRLAKNGIPISLSCFTTDTFTVRCQFQKLHYTTRGGHNGMMHTSVIWTRPKDDSARMSSIRIRIRRKTIRFIYPWISIMSCKFHCLPMESRFMNTSFEAYKYLCANYVWKLLKMSHFVKKKFRFSNFFQFWTPIFFQKN